MSSRTEYRNVERIFTVLRRARARKTAWTLYELWDGLSSHRTALRDMDFLRLHFEIEAVANPGDNGRKAYRFLPGQMVEIHNGPRQKGLHQKLRQVIADQPGRRWNSRAVLLAMGWRSALRAHEALSDLRQDGVLVRVGWGEYRSASSQNPLPVRGEGKGEGRDSEARPCP